MATSWHAVSIAEALAECRSRETGLTSEEAARRLADVGPNQLPAPPTVRAIDVLAAQFKSAIVYLLIAAIAVSLAFGDHLEAAAIVAVLVLNATIGFVTEVRARRAMEALISLEVRRVAVWRDGAVVTIASVDLVPGDVIDLAAGGFVPADGRLMEATDFGVDEAPLTGESMPVTKSATDQLDVDTPLADRRNMTFMGTSVATGVGRVVVTATGAGTELGRIGALVGGITIERTPLEKKLDVLGRRLVWLTLAIAGLVAGIGILNDQPFELVVQTAIALAIAAVPEALPAVATIALAVGMHRMARRHALVRRLPAVESLGSTTVVCTDKTRTLTSGEMTVVRVHAGEVERVLPGGAAGDGGVADDRTRDLLTAAALAVRLPAAGAQGGETTDPVDRAMLAAATGAGFDLGVLASGHPETGLVPFSSERKLMAVFREEGGRRIAFVKGAPSAVIARCADWAGAAGARPLDGPGREAALDVNRAFASDGLRVLAVARGEVAGDDADALAGLTLLGFVGLADPPAPGVKATIDKLRRAHLRTVMLTGDQKLTAQAIGRELGVLTAADTAIDGRELDRLSAAEVTDAVGRHAVFSRISPEHKLIIVRALQARGEIVAMLGDGVNDAAALKQADVGVAMGGRGTDVAKQAAAIVLQDDRFETVASAVEEGRVIYDNIRKFVFYLFSCNVAEILVLLVASLAGAPLPLLPLQLLWLNLVTDTFPALALALEPADPDVMTRPPRPPGEAVLSRPFLLRVLLHGGLITAATLTAFFWGLSAAPDRAPTIAFMTLAFAQMAHLGNARQRGAVLSLRRATANRFALLGVGIAAALQMAAYLIPAASRLLGIARLDRREWAVVVALSLAPAVLVQAGRLLGRRR